MKKILILASILFSLAALPAHATTLATLIPPPGVTACSGNSFDAADNVLGACRTVKSLPCSGRACQPVTYTYFYNVTWTDGVPGAVDLCFSVRRHSPQAPEVTYYGGHSAADCRTVTWLTYTVVSVNGVAYYYVATSVDGLLELVNTNSSTLLVTF